MDYPKLGPVIVWGLLGILCLVLSWRQEEWADWLRLCLGLAGLFLLLVALLCGINTLQYEANNRRMELQRALAVTERVALMDRLSKLRPDQIAVLDRYVPTIELICGDAGPTYLLRLPKINIPMTFVEEFLRRGDDQYFGPIRSYAEGTREREWATEFTSWAIFNGWGSVATGNRPAKWIDKQRCYRALGLN